MREDLTRFFASRWGIISAGVVIGVLAPVLVKLGNPGNMGICVACFERDIAGALGLHRAAPVQYLRPEIIGFVLGSLVAAHLFKEFRSRAGSAPIVRFVLGAFAMIGALAFLGCPWRATLRLAGGDLNALLGIAGLVVGIGIGTTFLKAGYTLGRAQKARATVGWVMPALMVGLLVLALVQPVFAEGGPIFASAKGPGSQHAALAASPDTVTDGVVKVGGVGPAGMAAVIIGLVVCLVIGAAMRERLPKLDTPKKKEMADADR